MIGKWYLTLDRITEYTKQPDGSWHADLRVPKLHVEGASPNDCRYRMADEFDAALTEWLEKAQKSPGSVLGGQAENAPAPAD